MFNWFVFTGWMFIAMLASRTDGPREVIFVSNPPFLPIAMWVACRLRGWEYTYIVYDLYPDQPVELGHLRRGGVIDRIWSWLNVKALRGAAHVVALGPVMKNRIQRKAGDGLDSESIEIIHNWADGEFIQPLEKNDNPFARERGLLDQFVVLYSGNIGEYHDLETLIRAAPAFEDEAVVFLIIGEGDEKSALLELAEELDVRGGTVQFLPYQPQDVLPNSLTAGDVSVVAVEEGFEGVCLSSKLYTALAAGTPVLCIAQPTSDEARIVNRFEAGLQVEQDDIDGLVDAIRTWRDQPELVCEQGSNARAAFEGHFTKAESIDLYYDLLSNRD